MSRQRKQKHDRRSWLAGRKSGMREAAKARAEEEARERKAAEWSKRTKAAARARTAKRMQRELMAPYSEARALKGGA